MLDLVVGLDAGSEMRIVRVGLQQAVCDWKGDQAGQCENEEGEELGLDVKRGQRLEVVATRVAFGVTAIWAGLCHCRRYLPGHRTNSRNSSWRQWPSRLALPLQTKRRVMTGKGSDNVAARPNSTAV